MNSKNNITLFATIAGILTFSILAMASLSINQASAQMADCQTTLSLASSPRTGTVSTSGFLQVNLLGELKCGDSGIGGATVIISGIDEGSRDVITDEFGKYSSQARLGPGGYELQAYFAGDETHISASATYTLQVNELSQDKFR
jgi:hypothetical protein